MLFDLLIIQCIIQCMTKCLLNGTFKFVCLVTLYNKGHELVNAVINLLSVEEPVTLNWASVSGPSVLTHHLSFSHDIYIYIYMYMSSICLLGLHYEMLLKLHTFCYSFCVNL